MPKEDKKEEVKSELSVDSSKKPLKQAKKANEQVSGLRVRGGVKMALFRVYDESGNFTIQELELK